MHPGITESYHRKSPNVSKRDGDYTNGNKKGNSVVNFHLIETRQIEHTSVFIWQQSTVRLRRLFMMKLIQILEHIKNADRNLSARSETS